MVKYLGVLSYDVLTSVREVLVVLPIVLLVALLCTAFISIKKNNVVISRRRK